MARRLLVIGLSLFLLLAATGTSGTNTAIRAAPRTRQSWIGIVTQAGRDSRELDSHPPVSILHMAMVQTAVFDAVNMMDRGYEPYLDDLPRASRRAYKTCGGGRCGPPHVAGRSGDRTRPGPAPGPVITRLHTLYTDAHGGNSGQPPRPRASMPVRRQRQPCSFWSGPETAGIRPFFPFRGW